jgi:arginyl-tRNA synthetase
MREDEEKKDKIAQLILDALKDRKTDISREEIVKKIEIPPSAEMGDFAFPCFIISSKLKENPSELSVEIRSKIKNLKDFSDIQTKGPYINFFMNRDEFATDLISKILSDNFGTFDKGKGKTSMIEFSQANTHKAFHVGHLRGTCIGESLARILEFGGNKVIRANYQGDSGMHVAKWIWCYKKFHAKEKLKVDESWIASIYVDAVQRLEKNKDYQAEVEGINRSLESGDDEKLTALWKKTREMSLEAFEKIYSQLNTHFDSYFFEKDVEERGKEIVKSLIDNKIAKKSQGAIIMDLKKYNLGVWVLTRRDGTILYSGKDLALVEKKFEAYPKLDESIYVIGAAQEYHFNQLVKTLELSKFPNSEKLKGIFFTEVRLPTGKMSSRTGQNILYRDFIKKVLEHTKKEIKKREPRIKKDILEDRALKVSVAAMKYDFLKQGNNKIIVFDIKEALNFEGNSGPYLQYSYARANSILNKSEKKPLKKAKKLHEKEVELIKKLSEFPNVVSKAYETLNPSGIANYSYQLAQTFNEFYHKCPVVGSKEESFRLALVKSFMKILKNSLSLLGIETLNEM